MLEEVLEGLAVVVELAVLAVTAEATTKLDKTEPVVHQEQLDQVVKSVEIMETTQEPVEPEELAVQVVLVEPADTVVTGDKVAALDRLVLLEIPEQLETQELTELVVMATAERLVQADQPVAVVPQEVLLDITYKTDII